MSANGYSLEDREEAYRLIKNIKEEFELCKAFGSKYDSFRSVCNRHLSKLKNENHEHLYEALKTDLVRCGLMDENGAWKLIQLEV